VFNVNAFSEPLFAFLLKKELYKFATM